MRNIKFCWQDFSEHEFDLINKTLQEGWVSTGAKTKLLECRLAKYFDTGDTAPFTKPPEEYKNRVVCLNSATAAEELNLRILGLKEGDEVIVPSYTYTASASAAIHCGAKVVFVDICKDGDSYTHAPEMDYEAVEQAINEKTKAVIPVDFGGVTCNYERLYSIVEKKKDLFRPLVSNGTALSDLSSKIQKGLGRVAIVADCAHALGAERNVGRVVLAGRKLTDSNNDGWIRAGLLADFSSFSFHIVKNLTTVEGGAATWNLPNTVYENGIDDETIYRFYQLLSLHGQSKDAMAKMKAGAWEYDIVGPWYKCNMTDLTASLGLAQLDRYGEMLGKRKKIVQLYDEMCKELGIEHLTHFTGITNGCMHIYTVRIPGIEESDRNSIITKMGELGIACNVHYKPLPLMTAYKDFEVFRVENGNIVTSKENENTIKGSSCPNSFDYYKNLVTLPLYSSLPEDDLDYVISSFKKIVKEYL